MVVFRGAFGADVTGVPVTSVAPEGPGGPGGPAGPAAPGEPAGPVGPVAPVGAHGTLRPCRTNSLLGTPSRPNPPALIPHDHTLVASARGSAGDQAQQAVVSPVT